MGILKDLYYGNVNPLWDIIPQDKEYYPLIKKIGEESEYFKSKLSEADQERFENYLNLVYQSERMQNYSNFEQGYILGAKLIFESNISKENNVAIVKTGEGRENITGILVKE